MFPRFYVQGFERVTYHNIFFCSEIASALSRNSLVLFEYIPTITITIEPRSFFLQVGASVAFITTVFPAHPHPQQTRAHEIIEYAQGGTPTKKY